MAALQGATGSPFLRLIQVTDYHSHAGLQKNIDRLSKTFGRAVIGIHNNRYTVPHLCASHALILAAVTVLWPT